MVLWVYKLEGWISMDNTEQADMAQVPNGVEPSRSLINRIRTSYRLALRRAPNPEDSALWSMIGAKQADIHNALMSEDLDALRSLLSAPRHTNLYYGVDNLAKDVIAMDPSDTWKGAGKAYLSKIEDLLVSLGGRAVFNPEGGARYPDKTGPAPEALDKYLRAVEQQMGVELKFPNPFEGELGLQTSRGTASERAIQAIYQACLARRYASSSCIEIGGGTGRTAYYGYCMGLEYTIIDLPMTIVGQALFLAGSLGEDAIWMVGDSEPRGHRIALLPPSELNTIGPVDVVINVDSLTEMGEKTATEYIRWISENAAAFLSINHEANLFTVKNVCQALCPASIRSRSPYWLRPGYVEEVFSFSKENQQALVAVYRSTSWRITSPLRKLASLFR